MFGLMLLVRGDLIVIVFVWFMLLFVDIVDVLWWLVEIGYLFDIVIVMVVFFVDWFGKLLLVEGFVGVGKIELVCVVV